MELNKIYNLNCLDLMAQMPDGFVDLTVTSPPYDNLRAYNGYEFDFEPIAKELYRVTKKGGVVVWVVGDATVNGSETGTSFRMLGHPGTFPETLARDHILSWSNENDLVFDPFMGSGTTAKAAHQLNRRWIGSEISAEYVALAEKRLEPYLSQSNLF